MTSRPMAERPWRLGRGLAWGRDGRSLLVGSLETSSDIVLFTRDR